MPPLSAQEQDDEQGNNEAENGGAFCQGGAQQQVLADLAFSFRLAADGLRCLDRKSTRLNSSHRLESRMPSSA